MVNVSGHVVCVRVRRGVDNVNSGEDIINIAATFSYFKREVSDDVDG